MSTGMGKDAAEAIKFEAEAATQGALAHRALREAEMFAAQTRKFDAEADDAVLVAKFRQMNFERETEKRADELTANHRHYTYLFNGAVTDATVKSLVSQLVTWQRLTADQEEKPGIEIIFNSPGGSVVDGMALWDFIQSVRRAGHQVTTTTYGMAASMAGILLQAGDTRVMGKESWLMIHEASFGASGKIGEVEDTVEWVKMMQERILRIFAERSTLSVVQLRRRWARKNWWISSDEALKLGLVDEVR